MTPNELKYSLIEKLCLALVFAIQKLKHYFQAHVIHLVSRANPIKFVMSKPVLNDRLGKVVPPISTIRDCVHPTKKAMKGQALADFLANHPIPDDWELIDELPDDDAMKLIGWLGNVTLQHMPRKENKKADALAALASTLTLPGQTQIIIYQKWIVPPDENEDEESNLEHLVAVTEAEKGKMKQLKLCKRHTLEFVDVVGPLPKSSRGHLYILAATGYFSKWAKAVALKEVKKENIVNFIRVNIIYHFRIPSYIIIDNGKPFNNKLMTKICGLFGFKQRNSSMYYAAANGLAEAFNKTLCNLLKKVISKKEIGMTEWKKLCGHIG
ncbi:uncharacterized protein [Nicotiana tomentosiformis]|uniref:uncharacterized protein n=1 Tax=Nicotiana tomentosiformis TaxID=4098 RepID=UPI00388CCA06